MSEPILDCTAYVLWQSKLPQNHGPLQIATRCSAAQSAAPLPLSPLVCYTAVSWFNQRTSCYSTSEHRDFLHNCSPSVGKGKRHQFCRAISLPPCTSTAIPKPVEGVAKYLSKHSIHQRFYCGRKIKSNSQEEKSAPGSRGKPAISRWFISQSIFSSAWVDQQQDPQCKKGSKSYISLFGALAMGTDLNDVSELFPTTQGGRG